MTQKLPQGTAAWFDMVGNELVRAAAEVKLPPDLRLSVLERYTDGAEIEAGVRQGLRIDVADAAIVPRTGVYDDEVADVMIEVTAGLARRLNLLLSSDPSYADTLETATAMGDLRVSGALGPIEHVFRLAHDRIVKGTV